MTEDGDEADFVTVAEAGRRCGIGERRAYRIAARLSDSDRQVTDTGKATVRLSAFSKLAGNDGAVSQASDTSDKVTDTLSDSDSHLSAALTDAERRAAVAEARAELLTVALDAEREARKRADDNLSAALDELRRANERATVLIAAVGAGRLQLPAQTEGETAPQTAVESPDTSATALDDRNIVWDATQGDSGGFPLTDSGEFAEVRHKKEKAGWLARVFGFLKEN